MWGGHLVGRDGGATVEDSGGVGRGGGGALRQLDIVALLVFEAGK